MSRAHITVTRNAGTKSDVPVLIRIARHAELTGPTVGDLLQTPGGPHRIGRLFSGGFQLAHENGRFYLAEDGIPQHSGGLSAPMIAALVDTGQRADTEAWVFGPDRTPRTVTVSARIWRVASADVSEI
ncbi:hypothetical protein [Nocardia africana]|uniref:Uncharacterized protein n=1 Tax=Nocardia africana TaxID=134964 RepID=A0A379X4M7_9NOCA|nr:hypothetical protein [Nocardia africana]MCC3318462.1 hypothetical protein [Nocardia africana]SUH71963.1 Uncharacterised protein [Nocardia africana]